VPAGERWDRSDEALLSEEVSVAFHFKTKAAAFTKVAQASRAFTLKVEKGAELASALRQAIEHVRHHRTQALVEIQVAAGAESG
jgi:thiamine pyrophosphate-dependent acetolactate synthase large subunit-like protein